MSGVFFIEWAVYRCPALCRAGPREYLVRAVLRSNRADLVTREVSVRNIQDSQKRDVFDFHMVLCIHMEKLKENRIPNLITSEGSNLQELENTGRAEILEKITDQREKRDLLLKKSNSLSVKIGDLFGGTEKASLKRMAVSTQEELYRNTERGHEQLQREIADQSRKILENTIKEPLYDIATVYFKMANKKQDGISLDLKLEEQQALARCNLNNIKSSFSDVRLRQDIVFSLEDLFLKKGDDMNPMYDHIERVHGYTYKEAKGFPVDVARAALEGLQENMETRGVSSIEDDPALFRVLNEIAYIYPDGFTEEVTKNIAELFIQQGLNLKPYQFAKYARLINLIEESPYKEKMGLVIEEKLNSLFKDKKWFDIDNVCKSYGYELSEKANKRLDEYLNKYGIGLKDIAAAWDLYPGNHKSGWRNLEKNMPKMESLEKERPGIIKALLSDFGIKEFCRYPDEVLINQFDNKDKDVPYGVVMYTNYDHNQAFDMDEKPIKSVFEETKEHSLNMRVMEFDSRYELIKNLASLNDKYGKVNKISYLLLGAHGSEDSFAVSYMRGVSKKDLGGDGIQRMKEFFVEQPEIIMASCSTGAENGIGQKISETYDATVHAPNTPTNVQSIHVTFTEDNKPHFAVKYRDDVLRKYDRGVPAT